ncbi:hypothetical protein CE91St41_19300 [Oscillospiraceae bacterium]|nr:hypothetical protein CE91St40_18220 [Oscillospiraceae bacterium]BDF75041.1 hypothetical protein CE91St41_19300 [Oscillospiraceae bacterium]
MPSAPFGAYQAVWPAGQSLAAGAIYLPRADKNQRGPRAAAPGGEKFAYYCWGVGLGSLIAGIVKLIALK